MQVTFPSGETKTDYPLCFKWLDTEAEEGINLGVAWPFEKLNPYDCVISSTLAATWNL